MRIRAIAALACALASFAAASASFEAQWRVATLPRIKAATVAFAQDQGEPAVRIAADASAASAVLHWPREGRALREVRWQWKVDRVVANADLTRREGDDFAARVYVTFDVPLDRLPFLTRTKIRIARLLYGDDLPTAALCYVWDNTHAVGTTAWNAYTSQVRMVVLRSGEAQAGQWVAERRDVMADFTAAFGERHPGLIPRVSGIAVSTDTDQTGEKATGWFRAFAFEDAS